jgi:hypothetical protein
MIMAIGDKQEAVRKCVHKVMVGLGEVEPIDESGTMGDTFHISPEVMGLFHKKIRNCLKPKFDYTPDPDPDNNETTSGMSVRDLIAAISGLTKETAGAPVLVGAEFTAPVAKKAGKKAVKKAKAKAPKKAAKKVVKKAAKKPKKPQKKAGKKRT